MSLRPVICCLVLFVCRKVCGQQHTKFWFTMHWCTVLNLPANRISAHVLLFVCLFVCTVTLEDSAEYPPILLVCRFRLSPIHYDPCYACLPTCCPNTFCRRYAFVDTFMPIRLSLLDSSRYLCSCFAPSPRRPSREYKRMVLELTHGLFIT
jgi:hypothetical protein